LYKPTISTRRNDGVLADYCDGKQCRDHELFGQEEQITIQIFLYYDDAEVVNPLGSSATIHELGEWYLYHPCKVPNYACTYTVGLFYFSLGNFEPRLRSQMNSIYLGIRCEETPY